MEVHRAEGVITQQVPTGTKQKNVRKRIQHSNN